MTDIEATIARVLELDEKATPGTYGVQTVCDEEQGGDSHTLCVWRSDDKDGHGELSEFDWMAVARFRTAAPELARALNEIIEADETDGLTQGLLSAIDERNAIEKQSNARIAGLNSDAESFRQRIIDAAHLRDDISDDDLVDTIARLISPSSFKVGDVVTVDRPEAHWSGDKLYGEWKVAAMDEDGALRLEGIGNNSGRGTMLRPEYVSKG